MKDLVRTFEDYADLKQWDYTYGTVQALNLKMDDPSEFDDDGKPKNPDKIYMLAEPTTRRYITNQSGNGKLLSVQFTGVFMMVQKSLLEMQYFREVTGDASESKYTKHVEPLLELIPDMINNIVCSDLRVVNWEVVDWIDFLDAQQDGIMVRYTLQYDF